MNTNDGGGGKMMVVVNRFDLILWIDENVNDNSGTDDDDLLEVVELL